MATIYDVAQAAGVSPKTVSRVMNQDAPVNAKTRERVTAAMLRLGYVPSIAARTMRSTRTGLIGLVTGAISGDPAAGGPAGLPDLQIVHGIQRVLADSGFTLLISDTGGDASRIPQLFRTLREHRVEGLFYVADRHIRIDTPAAEHLGRLMLVNAFDDARTPCVLPDDHHGEKTLVTALIARGHRRLGFLTPPVSLVAHDLRLAGYREALEEAGIPFDAALVRDADREGASEERRTLDEAIGALLALEAPPTVLCCGNDRLAVTVYGLLRARGIETGAIFRPLKNPFLNADYTACLESGGRPMVDRDTGGMRVMIRHIRKGGMMSILMDQYTKRGHPIDFLGQPAPSGTMIAELAVKLDLPMIPVYATRQSDGRIRVEFEAPIPRGTAVEMTQAFADSLGARVRATPGQYFWLHRRWVKVFPGEAPEA